MISAASQFITTIEPYVIPVIMGVASIIIGVILVIAAIRQIRKQVKLHNSISLVSLRSFKLHYWVFILLIAFFMFYVITQMADAQSPETVRMFQRMKMERLHTNIVLGAALGLLACVEFLLVVLAKAKCAVVDRGVYAGIRYLDWYHVHDYIIDEDRGLVILSCNKYTFGTLEGTTPPLKVAKNDIPKLKFILNKNKNKFSGFNQDNFR